MSRSSARLLVLVGTLLALVVGPAAGAAPNITRVGDPRGDVRVTAPLPRAAERSVDITELVIRQDVNALFIRIRVADVRRFADYRQRATVVIRSRGLLRQTYTTTGSRILKTAGDLQRSCGKATRRPGADEVTLRLPFRCIRDTPGLRSDLTASYAVRPKRAGVTGGASDTTRVVKVSPR